MTLLQKAIWFIKKGYMLQMSYNSLRACVTIR
jgi:hypothetical protein